MKRLIIIPMLLISTSVFAWETTYLRDTSNRIVTKDATYDDGTLANKVVEVSPVSDHHSESTLLNLTNIDTNTTAYAYIDMDGYRYLTLQCETSGSTPTDTLTLTIEATCQDDGTAMASCVYQDVTNVLTGSASYVDADTMMRVTTPVAFKYIRLKYVTSNGGGGDADLTVYAKKMY